MLSQLRPAVFSLALFTLLTGVLYPLLVTGLAQVLLPDQANGSLCRSATGQVLGSSLIGQSFDEPGYFWGRLSATSPFPYNAFSAEYNTAASGSNYGPLNPALLVAAQARIEALRRADPANTTPVPVDLATASGSGLDPHISPASALYQVHRVAQARGLDEARVRQLLMQHMAGRQFGLLGEARVNVLELNLALDRLSR